MQQQATEGAAAQAGESAETIPTPPAEATAPEAAAETKANPAGAPGLEKKALEKKAGPGVEPGAESAPEDPFAAKSTEEKKPAAEETTTPESKPTGKSILGTLLKKAGSAGGKAAGSPDNKPAENKGPEPADPFAK